MITIFTKSSKGFTLIELLVAATIVIILSAVGFVSFSQAGKTARDGKRKADLEQVRAALELYRSSAGTNLYPLASGGTGLLRWNNMVTALNGGSYLSTSTVVDPKNDAVTYMYTYDSPWPAPGTNGRTYRVCAYTLETSAVPSPAYCLTSP